MILYHTDPTPHTAARPGAPRPAAPAVNFGAIPQALRDLRQWVTWRYEWRADKDGGGKWTKVLYTPFVADVAHWPYHPHARANCPKPWASCAAAASAHLAEETYNASDGIGFVFAPGGGLFGVDLDNCLDAEGR